VRRPLSALAAWALGGLLLLIALGAGAARAAPSAAPSLPPFDALYAVYGYGLRIAESRRSLRPAPAGGRLVYESFTHAVGIAAWIAKDRIHERSEWSYHEGRPRPLHYVYDRRGGRKTRHLEMRFHWERGEVEHRVDGRPPWRLRVPPDAQDKLLYQIAIMLDLARGAPLRYRIADGGRLRDYRFEVLGRETVEVPAGRFETVKIRRLDDRRGTTVWCAPALRYLPVRLAQTETDGTPLRMELLEVRWGTTLPARAP